MTSFKTARFFIAVFSLATVLAGCVKPSPHGRDDSDDANFINGEVTGGAVVSKTSDGFSIPSEKLFSFKTCLRYKVADESIKGHGFVVTGGVETISKRTDDQGCLHWSEVIPFDGSVDPKYVQITRTITAQGVLKGSREVAICINPWDEKDAVRDCERKPVPAEQLVKGAEVEKYLKGTSKTSSATRQLWVDDMRLNFVHKPGNAELAELDVSVSVGPKLLQKTVYGTSNMVPITDGKFNVRLWLLGRNDSNQCFVLGETPATAVVEMKGGRLRNDLEFSMRYRVTYGQYEVVGTVTPAESTVAGGQKVEQRLRPFEGLWRMGNHQTLIGYKFLELRKAAYDGEAKPFDAAAYAAGCRHVTGLVSESESRRRIVEKILTGVPDPTERNRANMPAQAIDADLMEDKCIESADIPRLFPKDLAGKGFKRGGDFVSCQNEHLPSGIARVEQFDFNTIEARYEALIEDVLSYRTLQYVVTTKVTDPMAGGSPVGDVDFVVEKFDGSSEKVRTRMDGTLTFRDKIRHRFFEPERYMFNPVTIVHASGFARRLGIVLLPWENNNFFYFARDIRNMKKRGVAEVNLIKRPDSELLLTEYNWGTQGFWYEVSNFLNLTIHKQFLLKLKPRLLRYSSLTEGRMKNDPLRDGIYLLKLAIQRNGKPQIGEEFEYITAVRKLARVKAGEINTPIEMSFRDFRVLKIRSNLMVELQPIDESNMTPEQQRTLDVPIEIDLDQQLADSEKSVALRSRFASERKLQSSLDALADKESGLAARTFVGPVIAYSNNITSALRPTDDLTEAHCRSVSKAVYLIDCDEIKKRRKDMNPGEDEDEAKFLGSVKHLAGKSVTDMISRMHQLEAKYNATMEREARLPEFVKASNVEFVTKYNEDEVFRRDPLLPALNQVFRNGNTYRDLVHRLASIRPDDSFSDSGLAQMAKLFKGLTGNAPFQPAELDRVVFDGEPMSPGLAARLCAVFIEDIVLSSNAKLEQKKLGYFQRGGTAAERKAITNECLLGALALKQKGAGTSTKSFAVENILRISRLKKAVRAGGNLLNTSVGSDVGFGRSTSQSFSFGLGLADPVNGLLKAAGKTIPGASVVQSLFDASGISMGFSASESRSTSMGGGFSSSTSLAVEIRGMKLTLDEYERCGLIRLSSDFVASIYKSVPEASIYSFTAAEVLRRLSRGIFICEGTGRKDNRIVQENYYQFSQNMGDEAMNDPTGLENHPYLLTIRSRSDYVRFMATIGRIHQDIWDLPSELSIGEYPTDRLMSVFGSTLTPVRPGYYFIDPEELARLRIKPSQGPKPEEKQRPKK